MRNTKSDTMCGVFFRLSIFLECVSSFNFDTYDSPVFPLVVDEQQNAIDQPCVQWSDEMIGKLCLLVSLDSIHCCSTAMKQPLRKCMKILRNEVNILCLSSREAHTTNDFSIII